MKGFAFTLGLSTVLDLVVVFLFTHPLIAVLSRGKGFGSNRFSGLGRVDHSRRPAPPTRRPRPGRRRQQHEREQPMTPRDRSDAADVPLGTDADETWTTAPCSPRRPATAPATRRWPTPGWPPRAGPRQAAVERRHAVAGAPALQR